MFRYLKKMLHTSLALRIGISVGILFLGGCFFVFYRINSVSQGVLSTQEEAVDTSSLPYEPANFLEQNTAWQDSLYTGNSAVPVPTNQWYSSVAFTETSEPLFAYPLAIKMDADGFGVSYPNIVSTPDTVFGSYSPDIRIAFGGVRDLVASIDGYDDLSVGVLQKEKGEVVSRLRITHGSPYIFASLASKQSFRIVMDGYQVLKNEDGCLEFSVNGKLFALFFHPQEIMIREQLREGINIDAVTSAEFSIAVLPDRTSLDIFRRYAFDPIIGTMSTFDVQDNEVESHFEIATRNHGQTLFALLPKNVGILKGDTDSFKEVIGTYETLRGTQLLYRGNSFSFSQTADIPLRQFPVSAFSDTEKRTLQQLVRNDTQNLSVSEHDTYFLGKKLFALANVLDLAEQLGMEAESTSLKERLKAELETWRINTLSQKRATEKYFYYDPVIRGIVGRPSSFGSEMFNDHHFHYGYFIYAASILSRYDADYLRDNAMFINLLVKDIANIDRSDTSFPYIRGFDAYEGHSWASGSGLFADGNNQESSSEAVNAWYAIYLWSDVIHHAGLREAALYLYTEESSSALNDWLNINQGDSRFERFQHTFVSLVWGGKLDSATWFSPKPEARLGIQVLPISPGSLYLGRDVDRLRENFLSEASFGNPTLFKDYLAAYRAFFDISGARGNISSLTTQDIDSADSRSLLEAWLLTLQYDTQRQEN